MKALLFFVCFAMTTFTYSQNVGIGTSAPATPLHVVGPGGHVLRVEGTNPYISFFDGSTYSGYLWYNTNRMELGTPITSTEPVVIAPARTASAYFTTNGRVGLGVAAPTEKLDVNGNINFNGLLKVDGVSGTAGEVLTSNGASSPTWQNPNPVIGFHTENALPQTIVPIAATGTKLEFNSVIFNDGADFSSTTDAFTAAANGVYHFDVKVTFYNADPGNYRLWLDNNTNFGDGYYGVSYQQFAAAGHSSLQLSITLKLTAGQQVLAHVWHNATGDQSANFSYFSGHRIY